jgi:hypothetical protein
LPITLPAGRVRVAPMDSWEQVLWLALGRSLDGLVLRRGWEGKHSSQDGKLMLSSVRSALAEAKQVESRCLQGDPLQFPTDRETVRAAAQLVSLAAMVAGVVRQSILEQWTSEHVAERGLWSAIEGFHTQHPRVELDCARELRESLQRVCYCNRRTSHVYMIGCATCKRWFHPVCVGLSEESARALTFTWTCPNCIQSTLRVASVLANHHNTMALYNNNNA